jgi:tricorn protease
MRRPLLLLTFALLLPGVHGGARAGATDTRLLAQPAVSADHVAFVYAGDLWSATLAGADVRRLTTSEGEVTSPAFAPDGQTIAFSAAYDGNTDVYVVPVGGGAPKRLTWHPGPDLVQGFTPDGRSVVFTSARNVFTNRHTQLFTVPLTGGVESPLPIPNAVRAAYSGDGRRIAYNPLAPAFLEWKRYRGGRVTTISVFDVQTQAVENVAQPPARANDADPMWLGDTLYFRSDRDGEFNLYSYDRSKQIRQLTRHHDFPVLNAAAGGGHIVYEQAGYLHLFDPATGTSRKLTFAVPSDLRETRERFVRGSKWIRSATLSPSGARAAFDFRGDIVTVPAEKGDVRNLTASPGVHERSPVWSPDGIRIAYFSDESGENRLVVAPQDGKEAPKAYPVEGHGFYNDPVWSPDCQRISYVDNSQALYWIDLKTGRSKKIAAQQTYTPASQLRHAWSPDSKWLAYTIGTRPLVMAVSAYSVDQDKSFPISDGLAEVTAPAFDRSGKYLYFFGSTDAGPLLDWFSQASSDMRETRNVYLAVLRKDLTSPLAKESDEEAKPKPATETPEPADKNTTPEAKPGSPAAPPGGGAADGAAKAAGDHTPFRIDFDDIQFRILDVPVTAGELSNLQAGNAGQFYFIRQVEGKPALQRFDLEKRKVETVLPDVADYQVSADGKKLLYRSRDSWFIVPTTKEVKPGEGKIGTDGIEVKVNPRAEWNEIFSEAWRVNRDYFYDPGMHGVDWKAARAKYAAFLPDVTTRNDLNRVMQWMASELSVGHHRISDPGDVPAADHSIPGGLLGADYTAENGRYRFAKVYGGLNWTPELRAPLTEPGINVKAGEYLLAVNGRDVRPTANLFSFFENTAGKIVELSVGPNADGSGSRTVQVVPVPSEQALRNRAWVEGNLRKVDKATEGRVAYVYVPNTAEPGHAYFKRYFYPQSHKDAVIVDERFNGGGQVADYYIDILRRPLISYWAMRYGADLKTPTASIQGPKVMIIDETAGSGGDLLPWMFRKLKLGTIVGKRTWGGLVGVLGFPDFIDGGSITAPNLAIWTEDGWIVENEGVPPDIEVEQTPADVIAGRDPQLDKAIAVALAELKKNPPAAPARPAHKKLTGGSR